MADRLTWTEIQEMYPDEYVVIIDSQHNESTRALLAAVVLNHSPDKHAMYRFLGSLNVKDAQCVWTGVRRRSSGS